MKTLGLVSSQQPRYHYKKAEQPHLAIPNRLGCQFDVETPDKVWEGDITHIWTGKRWVYLAVVLDLLTRKPVDLAISFSTDSGLTRKALMMAYESSGEPQGVMFHSDQENQYTSLSFRQLLWKYQINQSMSRRSNCWDNSRLSVFSEARKQDGFLRSATRRFRNRNRRSRSISLYAQRWISPQCCRKTILGCSKRRGQKLLDHYNSCVTPATTNSLGLLLTNSRPYSIRYKYC